MGLLKVLQHCGVHVLLPHWMCRSSLLLSLGGVLLWGLCWLQRCLALLVPVGPLAGSLALLTHHASSSAAASRCSSSSSSSRLWTAGNTWRTMLPTNLFCPPPPSPRCMAHGSHEKA
jgi:hypothetical protein